MPKYLKINVGETAMNLRKLNIGIFGSYKIDPFK